MVTPRFHSGDVTAGSGTSDEQHPAPSDIARFIRTSSLMIGSRVLRYSTRTLRRLPSSSYSRPRIFQLQLQRPQTSPNPLHRGAQPPILRTSLPRRSAIDPITFLVALAVSAGVAYIATTYTVKDTTSVTLPHVEEEEELEETDYLAHLARLYPQTMSSKQPPGRPGNLTADQEAKLKDMWSAVLEVFGVSHEAHANGTSTTASDTTASPDAKKKKKGRLSLFGKKDKHSDSDGGLADGGDNDKHGQTKEFQQAIASQSPESLREAFWAMSKHDHPDALLLRFLRARKWDVQAALVMMVSTMHWRSMQMHVDDDIMKNGEGEALRETKSSNAAEKKEGDDFMAQLRMGKSFLHGTDKDGRPCCYVRVRLHKQGEQSERSLERFTVYTIETARMMLRPPVDTAVSPNARLSSIESFWLT